MRSRRILLTGGRSRLGSAIRPALVSEGSELISLSRTADDRHVGIEELFTGDLVDRADTLIHLAWSTVPMTSENHVGIEWEQDLPLLLKVLKTVVSSPNREKLHFVFFSSGGAVYGNSLGNRPSQEPDPCEPVGWYGHGKLAAERLVTEFGRRHGLVYTILRISNPYGFQIPMHKPQGIVPRILKHAREGTPFSIWGDGSARKDFLYHTDFAAALKEIIDRRLAGIFNVSSGASHSVNEVIRFAEQALGRKVEVQHLPAHAWDVHDSLLDNTKLLSAVGWRPLVSLADGIRLAAADFK